MNDILDTSWKPYFAERVLDLHESLTERGLHPLQCWAEMDQLISNKKKDLEAVPRETVGIKKIFPNSAKKVEPHVDEEQSVEYDKDGDTIFLTKPNA